MLHVAMDGGPRSIISDKDFDKLLAFIEDGGEMLSASLMLGYIFFLKCVALESSTTFSISVGVSWLKVRSCLGAKDDLSSSY